MTETSVVLTDARIRGVTEIVAFTEPSPVEPFAADRLLLVNPSAQKLVIVAANTVHEVPVIVDESDVITPPPTQAVAFDQFIVTLAEWSVSNTGQLRVYLSTALTTPVVTVDDVDAGGPLALGSYNGTPFVVHGRTNGARLVVRSALTLSELSVHVLPANPVKLLVEGTSIWVFCEGRSQVECLTWNAAQSRLIVGEPLFVPGADRCTEVAYDGSRLLVAAGNRASIVDAITGEILLDHRDNFAGFSSVDTFPRLVQAAVMDGTLDDTYLSALYAARFNPGKDRQERDPLLLAEQLAKIGAVFGTEQMPVDPVTNQVRQRVVRRIGERWYSLNNVVGQVVQAGVLVWRFRGADTAADPVTKAYAEPDAPAGTQVSTETAVHSRMAWSNGVSWKKTAGDERYAYLDGTTDAAFGSVKTVYLPTVFTMGFWVKPEVNPNSDDETLLGMGYVQFGPRYFGIRRSGGISYVVTNGSPFACTDLYDGAWHHIAIVHHTDTTATLYVDGLPVATDSFASVWTPQPIMSADLAQPVYLGRRYGDTAARYQGYLGDCRIYRAEKDDAFIAALYSRGPVGNGGSVVDSGGGLLLESDDVFLLETGDALLTE
jgi:hypothetical protein